jgi:hypothetical protein
MSKILNFRDNFKILTFVPPKSYKGPPCVGCLAQITCQLQNNGLLEVISFHEQHNHEFAHSPMKHILRLS